MRPSKSGHHQRRYRCGACDGGTRGHVVCAAGPTAAVAKALGDTKRLLVARLDVTSCEEAAAAGTSRLPASVDRRARQQRRGLVPGLFEEMIGQQIDQQLATKINLLTGLRRLPLGQREESSWMSRSYADLRSMSCARRSSDRSCRRCAFGSLVVTCRTVPRRSLSG